MNAPFRPIVIALLFAIAGCEQRPINVGDSGGMCVIGTKEDAAKYGKKVCS